MSEKTPAKKAAAPKKKTAANGAAKKPTPTKSPPAKKVAVKTAVNKKSPPAKVPSNDEGLYVVVSSLSVSVSPTQPAPEVATAVCASFDEARQTAIDALVSAIEDAEHTLLRFKRASTLAELGGE